MADLLGPADAPFAVTVRPADTRVFGPDDTYFKDCSSALTDDGTDIQAAFLNGLLEQARQMIRRGGAPENNTDDTMLAKAVRNQKVNFVGTFGGTATALTAALDPAPASWANIVGTPIRGIVAAAPTGAMTLNLNGIGAKPIKRADGADIQSNEFTVGQLIDLIYDGTNVQVLNYAGGQNTQPYLHIATWSQQLTDTTQTDVTNWTTVNSNLGDATFTSGVLTVGPKTAGLWFVALTGQHPIGNSEMLTQVIDDNPGGSAFAYNSSRTTAGAPFVTATGGIRRNSGQKMRMQARQISGGVATCSGRVTMIRIGG